MRYAVIPPRFVVDSEEASAGSYLSYKGSWIGFLPLNQELVVCMPSVRLGAVPKNPIDGIVVFLGIILS